MHTQTQAAPAHVLAARAAGLSPYMLGSLDAAARRPCAPADFDWPGDAESYSEGYRDEAGAMFNAMLVAMVGEEDMQAAIELAQYRSELEDEAWVRHGC